MSGVALTLTIGQRVRHRDYQGKRVTGTVRSLGVEENALMATIVLDEAIVIPARGEFSETSIWTQHVPAHELAPFDDRDEVLAALLEALRDALEFIGDQEDVSDGPEGEQVPNRAMSLAQALRAVIARVTGSAS